MYSLIDEGGQMKRKDIEKKYLEWKGEGITITI